MRGTKNSGITLIALIITIIIMLILVGVSINILIQSDLLGIAQKAGDETKTTYENESNIEQGIEVGNKTLSEYLASLDIDGGPTELQPGEKSTVGKNTYKNVPIPEGFTVSGITEESNSIEDGIVIYDIPSDIDTSAENFWTATTTVGIETNVPTVQTLYNQYVWVPVEKTVVTKEEISEYKTTNSFATYEEAAQALVASLNEQKKYPMAVQCEDGNYRGLLYNFGSGQGTPVKVSLKQFSTTANYTTATYNREPAYLNDSSNADGSTTYNTIEITQQSLQTEYNNIVESVAEYGGFYVARYQLTQEGTDTNLTFGSKRGKTVANANAASANMWYGLYSTCQTLDSSHADKATSTMIYGSQWDQIMIWMKEVKNTQNASNYYIRDSSYMGNYSTRTGGTGKKQVSGYSNNYSVKKIFDLGGNLSEWTTEANNTSYRVMRGYDYVNDGNSNPVAARYEETPKSANSMRATRPVLYINL